MMVLTDASRHDWPEGRGPQFTLIGFQDDATSQILSAHFQLEAENTLGYFRALRAMVDTPGVSLSLYRDRHGIFQRNNAHLTLAEQLAGQQCPTHLGRALEELGIQQIPAYPPPAKGRIERAWRTCEDRLVSELRLAQACDLDSANRVLARFCAHYNQRFAVPAREAQCDRETDGAATTPEKALGQFGHSAATRREYRVRQQTAENLRGRRAQQWRAGKTVQPLTLVIHVRFSAQHESAVHNTKTLRVSPCSTPFA
jgi:hypothetical protein